MPRIARIVVPGSAHHATQRGSNRQNVFKEIKDYENYCRWINRYSTLSHLEILAYCLMPNHVHFIVIPREPQAMSKTFQLAHMRCAQYIHGKRKTSGHLWRGRFYSCAMVEAHLYRAVRYVKRNPVRSGLAAKTWDYRWSSAKYPSGLTNKPHIALGTLTIACQDD